MPEWSIQLLTGLAGVLVGAFLRNVPKIISAHGELKESDRRTLEGERKQFLKDIRIEREEVKKELAEVRAEHQECLETKTRQEEKIDRLEQEIETLKGKVETLENDK